MYVHRYCLHVRTYVGTVCMCVGIVCMHIGTHGLILSARYISQYSSVL